MRGVWLLSLPVSAVLVLLLISCAPEYPECRNDEDCQRVNPQEFCINGQCRQCRDDSHCQRGQQCDNGSCQPIPGWCETTADCSGGQVCSENFCRDCQSDGECVSGYGERFWCDGGRCSDACRSDADCPAGQQCVNGACVSPAEAPVCQLGSVYFDFDQSSIRSDQRSAVETNASCIRERELSAVTLEGNCDPRGTTEYNYALGEKRAASVKRMLTGAGIRGNVLKTVSYGEDRASGSDESSWARDRRVDSAE
jgi:peptidoglycan-associated lipoprotein